MPDLMKSVDGTLNYSDVYRQIFNFQRKYTPPRIGSDGGAQYWESLSFEIVAMTTEYNNHPFVKDMLNAVYSELGREFEKEKRKHGN